MAEYQNTEAQARPIDTTTESRSSSLASLFSQGTMDVVQMFNDPDTTMEGTRRYAYDSSRSSARTSVFGSDPSTRPRDSGYASSNNIYKAWPAEESTTYASDRTYSATSVLDQQDPGNENSNGEDSSDEEVEDYVPPDDKGYAEYKLVMADRLRKAFSSHKTPESRRRAIEKEIRLAASDENLRGVLWTYFYQHPEDLPHNAARDGWWATKKAKEAGYVHFMEEGHEDEEEQLDTWERQQECFGDWNWPEDRCTAEFPVKKGPRDEKLWVKVEPPPGRTWESLREEQQRKLKEYHKRQQQPGQRIEQQLETGIERSKNHQMDSEGARPHSKKHHLNHHIQNLWRFGRWDSDET